MIKRKLELKSEQIRRISNLDLQDPDKNAVGTLYTFCLNGNSVCYTCWCLPPA